MKKFDITVSLGIIILCVLLMILVVLRSIDGGGTAPSYRFLAGRDPITCEKAKKGTEDSRGAEDRRYTYSFEADFNDVCSKADAELIPAGFVDKTLVAESLFGDESSLRTYYLKARFPRGPVWVHIYNSQFVALIEIFKKITKSEHYTIAEKDGWVTVEIVYRRSWWRLF